VPDLLHQIGQKKHEVWSLRQSIDVGGSHRLETEKRRTASAVHPANSYNDLTRTLGKVAFAEFFRACYPMLRPARY
jgi:hypothetical protein